MKYPMLKKMELLESAYKLSNLHSKPQTQSILRQLPENFQQGFRDEKYLVEKNIDYTMKIDMDTLNKLSETKKILIKNTFSSMRYKIDNNIKQLSKLDINSDPQQTEILIRKYINSNEQMMRMGMDILKRAIDNDSQIHKLNELQSIDGANLYEKYLTIYNIVEPFIG
jgi:hypothetical protein